jgi:hypothetical protein
MPPERRYYPRGYQRCTPAAHSATAVGVSVRPPCALATRLSPTYFSHRWQWETADRRGLRPGNRSRTARRATSRPSPGRSPTCSSPSLATSPPAACRTCSDQTGVAVERLCARSRHRRRPATSTASFADGRLARQLGLAGSVAVVTHCGSVVPPGRRRGWPQRAGGRCFPSLLAYTELPVRRWPPAGARPRAHSCGSCAGERSRRATREARLLTAQTMQAVVIGKPSERRGVGTLEGYRGGGAVDRSLR